MTSSTREVITLQFGHYSNFVGTHFWNIQESSFVYSEAEAKNVPKEINNDVLFREGKNLQGELTYTPRLIAFDLKGSLNTLKQDGLLYDLKEEKDDFKWAGDITLHQAEIPTKNSFLQDLDVEETAEEERESAQSEADDCDKDGSKEKKEEDIVVFGKKLYNLDNSVEVWSDFLRLHLHPQSIHVLDGFTHEDESKPFDVYGLGCESWKNKSTLYEIEDRLHFFVEECDNMQGIQILVDAHDGFGGLASSMLEELKDEYSGKAIMTFATSPQHFPSSTPHSDLHRMITTALSYVSLVENSSSLLPMSTATSLWRTAGASVAWPHLNYRAELAYHSSAILAASFDSLTSPFRLQSYSSTMSQMADSLTPFGRQVLAVQSSLPFPLLERDTLVHSLQAFGDQLPWLPLTPLCRTRTQPFAQSVVLRGIPGSQIMGALEPRQPGYLSHCSSVNELMELYLSELCPKSMNAGNVLQTPCKVTAPFPHVFSSNITVNGQLSTNSRSANQGVESVPVMTSLQSTSDVGLLLNNLHEHTAKLNIRKYHRFLDTGLESDEFSETLNSLKSLSSNYQDNKSDMELL